MINYQQIPSPAYVLEEALLLQNLQLMKRVQERAGVDIILAFKGFAMWSVFPLVRQYLAGATASSLYEARLCFEEMQSEAHTYAAAFRDDEFLEILQYSGHISFNSIAQFERFYPLVQQHKPSVSCGIRVNPEYSPVDTALYNPCAPGSRLGTTIENFVDGLPKGVEGLHFHALCESKSFDLAATLASFERIFGHFLPQLKWVNMGGGHLMTHKDYDVEHLITVLTEFKQRYPHLQIILEPGSAVAWQTGDLVSTVLDIVNNKGIKTAMLDVSFTAHMPDTLEMPYRPVIVGATDPVAGKPTYRIGGMSCLSGDFMEEYSFEKPLAIGDRLIFKDMMHYTMVKTTMFNGVSHPHICIWTRDQQLKVVRSFTYEDYKYRLS